MTGESREFWSQGSQVEAFPATTGALAYETALLVEAAALAATTGPLRSIHVIGVGTGRELAGTRAAIPAVPIRAWDISEPMVEACRRHVVDQGLTDVDVGCRDLTELTAADGPADVVVLLNAVLCYLGDTDTRQQAAVALRALLRPGGTLAAVVHQPNGRPDWATWFAARGLLARLGLLPGGPGDRRIEHGEASMLFHHYRPAELVEMLGAAGMDDVRVQSLRSWARRTGHRIPRRSPNPLLILAR